MQTQELRIGATFYRELTLYSDAAKTLPIDLTYKTPRASLMQIDGTVVAVFACAKIGDPATGRVAWTMPRATTSTVAAGDYIADIDLDNDLDGTVTDPGPRFKILAVPGQIKAA